MDSEENIMIDHSISFHFEKKLIKISRNLLIYIFDFSNKKDIWSLSKIKNKKIIKALLHSHKSYSTNFFSNPATV